ncbi:hypothetical protein IAG44_19545 [Streptomyces roseirectus]|uniref:Uncharacterized protein n=1 Tax=Streptomyces roseirectus TaxID=2768066 RepID=A0A7H0IF44_9ACTN|nr:hypothetical protein [Streptomyces roseirectus]QNP71410.1 hypothetical protein IAG44_19545 [Streptomyces roseirectus]
MSDERIPPPVPEVGTIMVDRQGRVGEFRAVEYGFWWLRPVSGGVEWTVEPGSAEPASAEQRLRTKVAVVNERTERRGKLG